MEDSMIFTEEEIRYYQALLAWEPSDDEEDDVLEDQPYVSESPVGQFMVLVLGAKGCGKTSMLERFCRGAFVGDNRLSNLNEHERGYRHSMRIEGETYTLNALELPSRDLSDEERLKKAVEITEAVVLVYNVKSRTSFDILQGIHDFVYEMIRETRTYGLILVGSNSDCEDEEREVSWVEGNKLARSFKMGCTFLETSAKTGENIDKIFPQLGEEVLKLRWLHYQQKEQAEGPSSVTLQQNSEESPIKRLTRWKSWARPWFQRKLGERKISPLY